MNIRKVIIFIQQIMFDFILIYIVSTLILIEISVIYYEKSWSNKVLKVSFIPIINTAYIIVGLSIVVGLYLYKRKEMIKSYII